MSAVSQAQAGGDPERIVSAIRERLGEALEERLVEGVKDRLREVYARGHHVGRGRRATYGNGAGRRVLAPR
jgi:hypothetical protein